MGVCTFLGRVVIVILNIVFLITSLGLLVVGLMARFATDVLDTFIAKGEDAMNDAINDMNSGSGSKLSLDLTEILIGLAIACIVLGIVLGSISMLGCCGACYQYKVLLFIYAVILVIILIAQAVVVGLFLGTPATIKDPIKDELKTGIKNEYKGLEGNNVVSLAWNVIMMQFSCCGVDNYKDFWNGTEWDLSENSVDVDMPVSCCKEGTVDNTLSCADWNSIDNYKDTGCFDLLWDMFAGNKPLMYGVFAGTLSFEILLITFTLMLFLEEDSKISPIG